jgi:hypothetical protein
VTQATLPNLIRYILLAGAVIVLAPYAGCHILTTPAPLIDEPTSEVSVPEDRAAPSTREIADQDDSAQPTTAASRGSSHDSSHLDDIEKLLQP